MGGSAPSQQDNEDIQRWEASIKGLPKKDRQAALAVILKSEGADLS